MEPTASAHHDSSSDPRPSATPSRVDLGQFDNSWYDPGRGALSRSMWFLVNSLVMRNPLNPSSRLRRAALRAFGARIGRNVVLKPGVSVKFPWNLEVGDRAWIGENAWLDSLAPIRIGADVCISQGAYFCTGNHSWTDPAFGLRLGPIVVEDGAWIAASAIILPGISVGSHAVVSAGAVLTRDATPYMIYAGNPAVAIRERRIQSDRAGV